MKKSVLDDWIKEKHFSSQEWSRGNLESWQLKQIQKVIAMGRERSTFYGKRHEGFPSPENWEEFRMLPLIREDDLRQEGQGFLCVSQRDISRIVTLQTSGTLDWPKRIFFTKNDQELTIDFFSHGMRELLEPGEAAAICLPFQSPGCVGDLLIQGLARQNIAGVGLGIIENLKETVEKMIWGNTKAAVGIPVQLLGLMEYAGLQGIRLPLKRVLTSTDRLPKAVRKRLENFGLEVFDHFGMTECGLGGAIECGCHKGMHIRENDLYMEILGEMGVPVADGVWGEVVITTLTREGMPLIRYGTGDVGRILPGNCPCESILRRLEIAGRKQEKKYGSRLLRQLDEQIFSCPGIVDFQIEKRDGEWHLTLFFFGDPPKKYMEEIVKGEEVRLHFRKLTEYLPVYRGKRVVRGRESCG